MIRITFFLIVAILLNVFSAWSQNLSKTDSDSSQCSKEINDLSQRIDSLEARLESMQIQIVESNPFKSGK